MVRFMGKDREEIHMRFKRIALAVIACLALTAVAASAAQAAVWKVAGTTLAANETISVQNSGNFSLESKVLGTAVKLKATGLECSGTCSLLAGTANATGSLKYTGVSFETPSTCSVKGGSLTTVPLTASVIMDPSGGEATFVKFAPTSGTTFVEFGIEGATCPLAGNTVKVKGTVAGRSANTGVESVSQSLLFSAAEQTTGGGSLTLGSEPATLAGTAINKLIGAKVGQAFGAI
jgi:hypothetical protein